VYISCTTPRSCVSVLFLANSTDCLIFPLLAAGLGLSVGWSGGVDRMAVADADQVAPEGCTLRLRSLGDRTSPPADWKLTVTLTSTGSYRTVSSFSLSVGAEGRWQFLTGGRKRLPANNRRARWPRHAKTCQFAGTFDDCDWIRSNDLPASGGWARFERRLVWGRGPHGSC
jgi:hypothetical protein